MKWGKKRPKTLNKVENEEEMRKKNPRPLH
jgi:hypothetical protein